MERYIEQLIDDIRKATWNLRPPHRLWLDSEADPENELELEDMSFVEQYIAGEVEPIAEITGIECEQLPPPERLKKEQRELLATELEKLLQYFNFYLNFPAGFPAFLRYPFIRDFWSEEHVPLSFGENFIEFCDYKEGGCPFPGYCETCEEIAEQIKFDEEHGAAGGWHFDVDDFSPSPEEIEDFFRCRSKAMEKGENLSGDDDRTF